MRGSQFTRIKQLNLTNKSTTAKMARGITDQAMLANMKGRQIRFISGKYGGKSKTGSGYGWTDSKGKILAKQKWVIVDMTGDGTHLKHTIVNRDSFIYKDWVKKNSGKERTPALPFEERLMEQHPDIENIMEQLVRKLARVHGLEEHMVNGGPMMMAFWGKYIDACNRQKKENRDDWIIVA